MEDKYKILYHYLWTRFRKETAQKAIDAASTDEYAQRNVLVGILRGVKVKAPMDKTHDE